VPAHKFFPGRGVALEALLDQLGILLQTSSAPISRNLLRQNPQEGFSDCHRLERKLPHKCSLEADRPGGRLAGILPSRPFRYKILQANCLGGKT
jgi:hypothetical protein